MKNALLICILLFNLKNIQSQIITPAVKERAEAILNQMTLAEKLSYIGGEVDTYPGIKAIPRLNLPAIKMADGPQGIRSYGVNKSTLFPSGILVASTWNRELIEELGKSFGRECRARGIHVLLGPGVNIYRSPLCGRNFEYYGEDPYLAGETAVSFIKGVQSQEVIATIKHFAANNQEWDRRNISSEIDERTLHEIYLKPFEKAVKESHVGAVMNSYNLLNGVKTCEHAYINIDVLRNMWNHKGILMSDWGSTNSSLAAANGGLDLDMPGGRALNESSLMPLIQSGAVTEETINTKVLHILQTIIAFGFLDRPQGDASIPLDNPLSKESALEVAREGIVLLKNSSNILPVSKSDKFLILGPNATKCVTGGGSGGLVTTYSCNHLLNGMKAVVGTKNVKFDKLLYTQTVESCNEFFTDINLTNTGFNAEYYSNAELNSSPSITQNEQSIDFNWKEDMPVKGSPKNHFSARWTTVYKPTNDALVVFKLSGTQGFRMYIDDKEVISSWTTYNRSYETSLRVEKNKTYNIRIEHFNKSLEANFKMAYEKFILDDEDWFKLVDAADNILLTVGFDGFTEKENQDRPFEIPLWQRELIDILSIYDKKIIAFVYAGGGVDFSEWSDKVQGIFMTWYSGQEGGKAMAEMLTGEYSPSGKLPISIEHKWEDNPVFNSYYADANNSLKTTYSEGVFMGYKGYEKNNIEPLYPFGFGLSYSSFCYHDFKIEKIKNLEYKVSFTVSNTGGYDAAEISQVYVGLRNGKVAMPVKELKGYEKTFLRIGESKQVSIMLNEDSFSSYDLDKQKFMPHQGSIDVMVGKSSKEILWSTTIELELSSLDTTAKQIDFVIHIEPSTKKIVIQNKNFPACSDISYSIYNAVGQKIESDRLVNKIQHSKTQFSSAGLYVVNIEYQNHTYKSKIIVN